jgi:RNA polymerase sigma factor (sigma-70 family)
MKKEEELKIIEQVKQGDLLAFRLLVDMHKTLAFNIALQVVRNREDAEEVAQDAFLKAWQAINSFKGESRFSTWLYRIVFNLAVSKTRKKKMETSHFDEVKISDKEIADALEAFHLQEKEDRVIQLEKALLELREDESLILALFYNHEKTIEDISQITNYSVSNVKVELHRARKKLFALLHAEANIKAGARETLKKLNNGRK